LDAAPWRASPAASVAVAPRRRLDPRQRGALERGERDCTAGRRRRCEPRQGSRARHSEKTAATSARAPNRGISRLVQVDLSVDLGRRRVDRRRAESTTARATRARAIAGARRTTAIFSRRALRSRECAPAPGRISAPSASRFVPAITESRRQAREPATSAIPYGAEVHPSPRRELEVLRGANANTTPASGARGPSASRPRRQSDRRRARSAGDGSDRTARARPVSRGDESAPERSRRRICRPRARSGSLSRRRQPDHAGARRSISGSAHA